MASRHLKVNPSKISSIKVGPTEPLTIDHQLRTQALMILEMYNYNPEEGAWIILSDLEELGLDGIAEADGIELKIELIERKLCINMQLAI